jgi:hypothetical protein
MGAGRCENIVQPDDDDDDDNNNNNNVESTRAN